MKDQPTSPVAQPINPMYAVICRKHGRVALTEAQYDEQMDRPDSRWTCPTCGDIAEWDDDCLCTNPPDDICLQCGGDSLRHTDSGLVCIDCGQLQEDFS